MSGCLDFSSQLRGGMFCTWGQDFVGLRKEGVGEDSKSEGDPSSSTFEGSSEAPYELAVAGANGQKEIPRHGLQ